MNEFITVNAIRIYYLQVTGDVSSGQDSCGCREENGENGEEILLKSIKDTIVGIEVGCQ
jgi:hypothetical protein